MTERTGTQARGSDDRGLDLHPGEHGKRGALAVGVFLSIGLTNVIVLLSWGQISPVWGLALVPPILFCSVLVWLVFGTNFLDGRR